MTNDFNPNEDEKIEKEAEEIVNRYLKSLAVSSCVDKKLCLKLDIYFALQSKSTHYQAVIEELQSLLAYERQEREIRTETRKHLEKDLADYRRSYYTESDLRAELQSTNQTLLKEMKWMYLALTEIAHLEDYKVRMWAKDIARQSISALSESTRKELEK